MEMKRRVDSGAGRELIGIPSTSAPLGKVPSASTTTTLSNHLSR